MTGVHAEGGGVRLHRGGVSGGCTPVGAGSVHPETPPGLWRVSWERESADDTGAVEEHVHQEREFQMLIEE